VRRLDARPERALFVALVLGFAVRSVIRRLGEGRRAWVGVCSALGAGAVVIRRRGDALTPVITWSLAVLVVDKVLLTIVRWRSIKRRGARACAGAATVGRAPAMGYQARRRPMEANLIEHGILGKGGGER
jgi:hypothetical protein